MDTTLPATAVSVMSSPLATVEHTESFRHAVEELAASGIGALVVLHGTTMVGVLSERDVVAHVANGGDVDRLRVGDVMQGEVVTTTGDASVIEAARTMVVADVRHLPVEVDGRVEGMLSARDCLAALSSVRFGSARERPCNGTSM